jgi:hypothetical protein
MSRGLPALAVLAAALGIVSTIAPAGGESRPVPAPRLPTDPKRWIGSPPTWESLRGRVVLLDVWTFG